MSWQLTQVVVDLPSSTSRTFCATCRSPGFILARAASLQINLEVAKQVVARRRNSSDRASRSFSTCPSADGTGRSWPVAREAGRHCLCRTRSAWCLWSGADRRCRGRRSSRARLPRRRASAGRRRSCGSPHTTWQTSARPSGRLLVWVSFPWTRRLFAPAAPACRRPRAARTLP